MRHTGRPRRLLRLPIRARHPADGLALAPGVPHPHSPPSPNQDEPWNWLQPGQSQALYHHWKFTLDCNYPEQAVYKLAEGKKASTAGPCWQYVQHYQNGGQGGMGGQQGGMGGQQGGMGGQQGGMGGQQGYGQQQGGYGQQQGGYGGGY